MAFDAVEQPKHYNTCGGEIEEDGRPKYETIKVIDAWGLGPGFSLGSILKYILRAQNKGRLQDLQKARWYLDHARQYPRLGRLHPPEDYEPGHVIKSWNLQGVHAEVVRQLFEINIAAAIDKLDELIDQTYPAKENGQEPAGVR